MANCLGLASIKWDTADFKGVKQQTHPWPNLGLGTIFKLFINSSYVKTVFSN